MAENKSEDFLNVLSFDTFVLETEAALNAGVIQESILSNRMIIVSRNASHHIARGNIVPAIHEIWDVIDYHNPDDELTVVDILILSLLTGMLRDHLICKADVESEESSSSSS